MGLATLLLLALPLSAPLPPSQAHAVSGSCLDADGEPVKGTVEIFFDVTIEGAHDVVVREAKLMELGRYRVEVPAGAWSAYTRAKVRTEFHHGPSGWLRGMRPGEVLELDPIICDEVHPGRVEVTDDMGKGPESGEVYFFPPEVYVDGGTLLSRACRACHRVATLPGRPMVKLPPLPERGGTVLVIAPGSAPGDCTVEYHASTSTMRGELYLVPAAQVVGTAPRKPAIDPGGHARRVLVAAFHDQGARHDRDGVAVAYDSSWHRVSEPVPVGFGQDFAFPAPAAYFPVIGAWLHGADPSKDAPLLIARHDEGLGRYGDWLPLEPARYAIRLADWSPRERERLARFDAWGNLTIESEGASTGHGVEAVVEEDRLMVTCSTLYPTDGEAELSIQVGGAELMRQRVPLRAGPVAIDPDDLASTTEMTFVVKDADTGAPVPGAKLRIYGPSHNEWAPLDEITCDDEGHGSGLFQRDVELQVVPNRRRFATADGKPVMHTTEGTEDAVEVGVVTAHGSIRVTAGEIDTQPVRVTLLPVESDDRPELGSYRTTFPLEPDTVDAWDLEPEGTEIAAIALRPGRSYLLEGVPEGRYVVGVETGLDLRSEDVYASPGAARASRFARTIEVERGEVTEVSLAPGELVDVEFRFELSKEAQKRLRRATGSRNGPRAVAIPCLVQDDYVDASESALPLGLEWTKSRTLVGQLEVGASYLVHLSGAQEVDSIHVVTILEGDQPPLPLDAAVELEIKNGMKRPFEVTIRPRACDPTGKWVTRELPEATLSLKPKRGKVLIHGLSPLARYDIDITQGVFSVSTRIEPIQGDPNTDFDKRLRARVKRVSLEMR